MNKPKEAFKDKKFLESPEGRSIRILSEYEKVVKKNRPTSWCYAKDIIKIKKRIEWFNHILAYD